MSAFRLRRAAPRPSPAYPAAPAPGEPPKAPLVVNRVSRLAPLAMLAIGGTTFCARPSTAPAAVQQDDGRRLPERDEPREVASLTDVEVRALVAGLEAAESAFGSTMRGFSAPIQGVLTEAEAGKVVEAFFRRNGLDPSPLKVRRLGVDFEVDAWDRTRNLGVEVLGAAVPGRPQPADSDLSADERTEISVLRARGDLRLLVLDAADYAYDADGSFRTTLPTKYGAVMRLLGDLERFLSEHRP